MHSEYQIISSIEFSRGIQINRVRLLDQSCYDQENFISLHIQNMKISKDDFRKLRQLKFLNILHPRNYYEERNEKILIFPDLQAHKLSEDNLKKDVYRILLQLALTYAEFEKRGSNWPLNNISQLYYLKGILYISLIEYDFFNTQTQQKPFQIFETFAKKYFSNLIPDINSHLEQKVFQPIIEYLLEKNGNFHKINYLNPPYENVLLYLLNCQQNANIDLKPICEFGNSVVKGFDTPECLKSVYSKLCDKIVYKSSRFHQEELKNQILNQIQREIELMEQCQEAEYVASCFAYIRIFDYSFILQKQFVGTLADFMKKWCQVKRNEEQTIKDVLLIAKRFALALKSLKQQKILHRDLKPENLFLDYDDLKKGYIYIADLDRSKLLDGQMGQNMTEQNVCNTLKYDPPETTSSFKYDNFQFGLIILRIANKYQYIGNEFSGPRQLTLEEHESYYSRQSIAKALAHTKYDETFLDVIAQCLKRNPEERPEIEEIYDKIYSLQLNTKMKLNWFSKNSVNHFENQQAIVRHQNTPSNPNNSFTPKDQSNNFNLVPFSTNLSGELKKHSQTQQEHEQEYNQNNRKIILVSSRPNQQTSGGNFQSQSDHSQKNQNLQQNNQINTNTYLQQNNQSTSNNYSNQEIFTPQFQLNSSSLYHTQTQLQQQPQTNNKIILVSSSTNQQNNQSTSNNNYSNQEIFTPQFQSNSSSLYHTQTQLQQQPQAKSNSQNNQSTSNNNYSNQEIFTPQFQSNSSSLYHTQTQLQQQPQAKSNSQNIQSTSNNYSNQEIFTPQFQSNSSSLYHTQTQLQQQPQAKSNSQNNQSTSNNQLISNNYSNQEIYTPHLQFIANSQYDPQTQLQQQPQTNNKIILVSSSTNSQNNQSTSNNQLISNNYSNQEIYTPQLQFIANSQYDPQTQLQQQPQTNNKITLVSSSTNSQNNQSTSNNQLISNNYSNQEIYTPQLQFIANSQYDPQTQLQQQPQTNNKITLVSSSTNSQNNQSTSNNQLISNNYSNQEIYTPQLQFIANSQYDPQTQLQQQPQTNNKITLVSSSTNSQNNQSTSNNQLISNNYSNQEIFTPQFQSNSSSLYHTQTQLQQQPQAKSNSQNNQSTSNNQLISNNYSNQEIYTPHLQFIANSQYDPQTQLQQQPQTNNKIILVSSSTNSQNNQSTSNNQLISNNYSNQEIYTPQLQFIANSQYDPQTQLQQQPQTNNKITLVSSSTNSYKPQQYSQTNNKIILVKSYSNQEQFS
ncbi:unnamed protein product [Paramecium sonneborni]|uniref:non-specific serine/threonine protein kinase n=1 Tax=Paramecium sonneborni TaxID=65129 RepID=A0A8S1M642_9CILI|nr:unnamed protein product [Paramecium sonneborni]